MQQTYGKQVFQENQEVLINYENTDFHLRVEQVEVADGFRSGKLSDQTNVVLYTSSKSVIKIVGEKREANQLKKKIDLNKLEEELMRLGVGGVSKQIGEILTQVIIPRHLTTDLINAIEYKHTRGIVLHGPPGTGKTLIARTMAKILNSKIKVVNGPEIFNAYYGETERNIRNLFQEAKSESETSGDKSGLYIIVFDELDSIARRRGKETSGNLEDRIINQLLTMIDGFQEMNNVLLIGTTNRIDLIDPALMRSGRLSLQLKIDLPDLKGRGEILRVHLQKLKRRNLVGPDIDIDLFASRTTGWSGAELAGLVGVAFTFATRRAAHNSLSINEDELLIVKEDLEKALSNANPMMEDAVFDFLNRCRVNEFIHCGGVHESLHKDMLQLAFKVKTSQHGSFISCILGGPSGTGKTTLAATVALNCDFSYVNVVSSQLMIGYNEAAKCTHIFKVLEDAWKCSSCLIIFDDIERLIEYNPIGPQNSNMIVQALLTFLNHVPLMGKHVLVVGTTSNLKLLEQNNILSSFSFKYEVPDLNEEGIEKVLNSVLGEMKIFDDAEFAETAAALSHIPIKYLYTVIDMARNEYGQFDELSLNCCLENVQFGRGS